MNASLRGDARASLFYALILATLALAAFVAPNMSRANGDDVVILNFPKADYYAVLVGCFTQYDGTMMLVNCQEGIRETPALELSELNATSIIFGSLTDNAFYWFSQWGECSLLDATPYADATMYFVECIADELFASTFDF